MKRIDIVFTFFILKIQVFYYTDALKLSNYGYHYATGTKTAFDLMHLENSVSRIVGGTPAPSITSYPYQAGLDIKLKSGWPSVCGGALISNTRVITAAHCWWDGQNQAAQFTVVLGSLLLYSGGTRIVTTDVVVHSNWNPNDITHDIAMVRISKVEYNNNIQVVPLPSMSDVNQNFAGQTAVATGYGKTSDAQNSFPTTTSLHHINLKIMTNTECQKSFDVTLHGSHLCTSGENRVGTCDGDSGGPLTIVWNNRRTLVGIVSFGLDNSCQAGFPSVYTRVTAFLTWINANL